MVEGLLTKVGHLCISERKVSQIALEACESHKYRLYCNVEQDSRMIWHTVSRPCHSGYCGCKHNELPPVSISTCESAAASVADCRCFTAQVGNTTRHCVAALLMYEGHDSEHSQHRVKVQAGGM
jgi:hypothetical protein